MPSKSNKNVVTRRPAETTALAGAVALLLARVLGLDDIETVTALTVVIGAIPAFVTWAVEARGKR